jgi:hypothetical protein
MPEFRILNSRKRAIIALVHSLAFGLLAFYQFLTNYHPLALIRASAGHFAVPIALTVVYLSVTTVLILLATISIAAVEKLYFLCCSASAGAGLLRVAVGDPTLNAGNMLRVAMLGAAVIIGFFILRIHSVPQADITP